MDPIATYNERAPGTRREFRLYSDCVTVHVRVLGGDEHEVHIPLEDISPRVGFVKFRVLRWLGGFLMTAVLASFVWLFVGPFGLPWSSPRVVSATMLSIGFLVWGIVNLRRYKAYRFVNRSGVVVLDVIEHGPEKARCRDFVALIERAIHEAAGRSPLGEPSRSPEPPAGLAPSGESSTLAP